MNHGDPLSDTSPYTIAAAFLWQLKYAEVKWETEGGGYLMLVQSVNVRLLRYWREEFYLFERSVYRRVLLEEFASDLTKWANRQTYFDSKGKPRRIRWTRSLEGDVLSQLRRLCQIKIEQQPAWLGAEGGDLPDPHRVVAFSNGLIDADAWVEDPGGTSLIRPTPEWFSESVLPCNYHPGAGCPKWLRFLEQSLADPQLTDVLQEWFGYCLTGDTSLEKMLWMHGVSGAGKSTVASVLQNVVGERNTVNFNLWSLMNDFGLSPFLGKRLAVSGDAHLGSGHEAEKVLATLKGISGRDKQQVNRKNRDILESVAMTIRFVISTNEFPKLPDASDALIRRAIFIPFEKSFQGQENPQLSAELTAELDGITVWALHGLRRLIAQGRFSESEASKRVTDEFRRLQSPVHAFVDECCLCGTYAAPHDGIAVKFAVLTGEMYLAYKRWAERRGQKPVSEEKLGERLRRVVVGVERVRLSADFNGKRSWQYRGIELCGWAYRELLNGGHDAADAA